MVSPEDQHVGERVERGQVAEVILGHVDVAQVDEASQQTHICQLSEIIRGCNEMMGSGVKREGKWYITKQDASLGTFDSNFISLAWGGGGGEGDFQISLILDGIFPCICWLGIFWGNFPSMVDYQLSIEAYPVKIWMSQYIQSFCIAIQWETALPTKENEHIRRARFCFYRKKDRKRNNRIMHLSFK